jgi:outer membrane protein assembly factor BamB
VGVNAIGCAPKRIPVQETERSEWRVPLGTRTRAPAAHEHVPPNPTEVWRSSLGRAASGPPAYGSAVIVALAADRYLSVLSIETGRRLWKKRLASPGVGGPLFDGRYVYAATGGHVGRVYAYNLRRKRRWQRTLGDVSPPLALAAGHVIAATERGEVVALDTQTGDIGWHRRLPQPARAGATVVDSSILVATDDSLYRLQATEGTIEARVGLPGTMLAPAAAQGDTLVVTTASGQVLALDATTLSILWSVATGSPIFGGAAVARDTAFCATLDGDVWFIPLDDPGRASHTSVHTPIRAPVSPTLDGVLIGTVAGEILVVRADGPPVSRETLDGPIEQSVLVRDGRMFTVDGKGRLQAWR